MLPGCRRVALGGCAIINREGRSRQDICANCSPGDWIRSYELQSRPTMNGWYYFWMANFLLAGSAFAVITVIVLVRGLRDLREMFANLRAEAQRPR